MSFEIRKVLNHGTGSRFLNRLLLQFSEILGSGLVDISHDVRNKVQALLYELAKDLAKAEESFDAYQKLAETAQTSIANGEDVSVQGNAISFNDPTEQLVNLFRDVVIYAAIAHRKLPKIASEILGLELKGGKALHNELVRTLEKDGQDVEWLRKDNEWLGRFYEIRGDIEHEQVSIILAKVDIKNGTSPVLTLPKLGWNSQPLDDYMLTILESLLRHSEDVVVALLARKTRGSVMITRIPQARIDGPAGYRYALTPNRGAPLPPRS